jgi:DNA-binding response OmpR family regulator
MKTPIKILLIEDDPDDVELLEYSLRDYAVRYEMHVISDGGLVSNYLLGNAELPDIIVLDLNLPRVHGKEILKKIKITPTYKDIPLLILTTSSTKEDIEYSYQHGANRFIKKPTTMEGVKSTIATIVELANNSLDPKAFN